MMDNYNPNQSPRLLTTFRAADLEAVFGLIHAGQSVEIIGVGSVGKSNFVRHLIRQDVLDTFLHQRYQEKAKIVFVGLDANSLLEPLPSAFNPHQPSGWSGYELLASRLLRAVVEQGILDHLPPEHHAHPEELYAMYQRLWPDDKASVNIIAFRYIEDMLQRIFSAISNIRFVVIFDEFEKFIRELPPRFFQTLRSLRDQFKDRLMYIITARQIMPLLIQTRLYDEYEPFIELFARHYLLPYRPSDTEQTFRRLSIRRDLPPPPLEMREQLMAVTGGHAGLLRASFSAWAPLKVIHPQMSDEEMIRTLLQINEIQEECKTIWRSLSQDECQILFDMVRAQQRNQPIEVSPYRPMAQLLIQKGLLLQTEQMTFANIRPPLFAAFLYASIRPETPSISDVEMNKNPNVIL
ncbi:MAG: hypothetical protein CUN55_03815 [Phototrophicales bacterium]|nr:MAG: hypothetical protein CUN55_03815 [Phototrophicales bacterium]